MAPEGNAKHLIAGASSLVILGGGIWLGASFCDWSFVTRSGTVIVVAGILFESWLLLTTACADDLPFWTKQKTHTAVRVAIVIVCFGTLVQGFGDLIVRRFLTCA